MVYPVKYVVERMLYRVIKLTLHFVKFLLVMNKF